MACMHAADCKYDVVCEPNVVQLRMNSSVNIKMLMRA